MNPHTLSIILATLLFFASIILYADEKSKPLASTPSTDRDGTPRIRWRLHTSQLLPLISLGLVIVLYLSLGFVATLLPILAGIILLGVALWALRLQHYSLLREKGLHSDVGEGLLREQGLQSDVDRGLRREEVGSSREEGLQSDVDKGLRREEVGSSRERGLRSDVSEGLLREEGLQSDVDEGLLREEDGSSREEGLQSDVDKGLIREQDGSSRERGLRSDVSRGLLREEGLQSDVDKGLRREEVGSYRERGLRSDVSRGLLREEVLQSDIGILQLAIMPEIPVTLAGLTINASYRPSEVAGGGDFFDAIELNDGQAAIIIGDVSGHGRKAIQQTALIHYGLRALMREGLSPRVALQRSSEAFNEDLGDSFATLLVCLYNPKTATLTWASAGHPTPLIVGTPFTPITVASAPPLGLGMHSGQRQTSISLPDDTIVCLFTDGLTEARVADGQLLGTENLQYVLKAHLEEGHTGERLSADAFLSAVSTCADTSRDDMATVLLHIHNSSDVNYLVEELEVKENDDLAPLQEFFQAGGLDQGSITRCLREVKKRQRNHYTVLIQFSPRSGTYQLSSVASSRNPELFAHRFSVKSPLLKVGSGLIKLGTKSKLSN